jgi:acyl-CoA hydrolase
MNTWRNLEEAGHPRDLFVERQKNVAITLLLAHNKVSGRGGMPKEKSTTMSQGLAGKLVSASRTEMVEVVLPQDANVFGNILGGRVMHLVDIAAAITAHRHCRSIAVTASVDHIDFRNPIRVGEVITLKASLNRAFHTSMEIGVKVFSEDLLTGEKKHTTSAYVTFVALDEHHRPKPVPPVICETAEDRRRFREALVRRKYRLAHRAK